MRSQFAATTTALLDDDPRAAVVLADISVDLFAPAFERHPERTVNVGIMEQTMVGVAAGFAMEGFHPIVHTLTPFLAERSLEQVKLDFGYQELGGTFVSVGASYDYATEGGTHHSPGDVQSMLSVPRMQVLVPGHPRELDVLLRGGYANGEPTYLRVGLATNSQAFDVAPGRLEVIRRGGWFTIIAVGPMLGRVLEASEGLAASVLYATSLSPFDAETLVREKAEDPVVVVVEPYYEGTTVPIIAEALRGAPTTIVPIGVPRRFLHKYGTPEHHDRVLGLDAAGIRSRLLGLGAGSRA